MQRNIDFSWRCCLKLNTWSMLINTMGVCVCVCGEGWDVTTFWNLHTCLSLIYHMFIPFYPILLNVPWFLFFFATFRWFRSLLAVQGRVNWKSMSSLASCERSRNVRWGKSLLEVGGKKSLPPLNLTGFYPQNEWFIMENPIKMDDLEVPLFLETHIAPKNGWLEDDRFLLGAGLFSRANC